MGCSPWVKHTALPTPSGLRFAQESDAILVWPSIRTAI